MIYSSI